MVCWITANPVGDRARFARRHAWLFEVALETTRSQVPARVRHPQEFHQHYPLSAHGCVWYHLLNLQDKKKLRWASPSPPIVGLDGIALWLAKSTEIHDLYLGRPGGDVILTTSTMLTAIGDMADPLHRRHMKGCPSLSLKIRQWTSIPRDGPLSPRHVEIHQAVSGPGRSGSLLQFLAAGPASAVLFGVALTVFLRPPRYFASIKQGLMGLV